MSQLTPDLKAVAENPELVARMVALVRGMVAVRSGIEMNYSDYLTAADIAAKLPKPIDPDLLEARKVAIDEAIRNGQRTQIPEYESGKWDHGFTIHCILAGIKRGRDLSERSRTEAERG